MLMPQACQPPPPRPTQNTCPAERSGAERWPAQSDLRQLQPITQQLETTLLIYVPFKCLGSGSHEIPGISITDDGKMDRETIAHGDNKQDQQRDCRFVTENRFLKTRRKQFPNE
jgi:hypothetical protein